MRIGAKCFKIGIHGQKHIAGAGEGIADAFLQRFDAPALPQEGMAAARAEVGNLQPRQLAQAFNLTPHLRLGARIKHIERKRSKVLHRRARTQLVDDGKCGNFPHGRVRPRSMEMQLVLAVLAAQIIFRKLEIVQPVQELGLENLLAAIETVTRQPDHFLLGEAQRAGMVELRTQFALIDLIGKAHRGRAVDEREGCVHLGVKAPNHLQHQKLVEVRIQKAADDGIELPCVIVDAARNISLGHDGLQKKHVSDSTNIRLYFAESCKRRVFTRLFNRFTSVWEALRRFRVLRPA